MSAPMKTRRISNVQITFEGKTRTLYLVPKDKADRLESLLESYRTDDFIPAEAWLEQFYSQHGQPTKLRTCRLQAGLSQQELAKKMSCPQSWISGWETGRRPLGKMMAKKLAKIFRTSYQVFL